MAKHLAGLTQESGSRQGVDQGSMGLRDVAVRHPHTAESYGTRHCKEWHKAEEAAAQFDGRGVPKVDWKT